MKMVIFSVKTSSFLLHVVDPCLISMHVFLVNLIMIKYMIHFSNLLIYENDIVDHVAGR